MPASASDKFNPLEDVVAAIGSLLPTGVPEDIRKNILGSVTAALEQMDVATRAELEVQETVLRRTRQKVQDLEARILELEKQLRVSDSASTESN